MKVLLIKDFQLLKAQKSFFIVLIAVAVGMGLFSYDTSFITGFLTFAVSLFTISTVSYDEFDNGNAFLFSLPISRTGYVMEKYCFGMILGGGSWVLSAFMVLTAGFLKGNGLLADTLMTSLAVLPFMLIILAVMLPFQLKFNSKKGRIAIIGCVGILMLLGIIAVKAAAFMGIDAASLLVKLPPVSAGTLLAVAIAAALAILAVSMKLSIAIVNRKEF